MGAAGARLQFSASALALIINAVASASGGVQWSAEIVCHLHPMTA